MPDGQSSTMALPTEVQSSSIGASPSRTSSDASQSNPAPSDRDSDLGLSASPPLILAFLAVGIFGIAMIVFFGWKRIRGDRRTWPPPDVLVPKPGFGELPKLWDLPSVIQQADMAEWHDILVS